MTRNRPVRFRSSAPLVHLALLAVAVFVAVPLLWALSASFGTNEEIFRTPIRWIPSPPHPENYSEAFKAAPFARFFLNSFVVAAAVTLTTLAASALAGYGFAKFDFPGKGLLFSLVIAAMLVPLQAFLIPLFVLVRSLGWLDSFAGLIVPGAVSGFGIFLMRQFMRQVPDSLCEAGRIDGANELQIFWYLALPLARSSLAALAVLTFLASWNNFLWPLIVAQSPKVATVPLGLMLFRGSYFTNYVQILAVAMVAALPVTLLYILMQRQIVASFASSGVKG